MTALSLRAKARLASSPIGSLPPRRRALLGVLVVLLLGGAIVGQVVDTEPSGTRARNGAVTGDTVGAARNGAGGGATADEAPSVASTGGAGTGAVGDVAGSDAIAGLGDGSAVIKTADLTIEVAKGKVGAAFDRATALAARFGGYVASSSTGVDEEATGDERPVASASLTLRIPAAKFDAARAELAALGTVTTQSVQGTDVSGELVDLRARLRNLRAQESALLTLMARATTVGEVLQVQNQVFSVRQQIEQLDGRQAQLKDQVEMARISVSIVEPGGAATLQPEEPKTGLAKAWQEAIDGAESVVAGTIILIGYLVPLTAIALLIWAVASLRRPRRAPTGG